MSWNERQNIKTMGMKIADNMYDEATAQREDLIATKYNGNHPDLKGKSGGAYLKLADNQWFFRPDGGKEDYRVLGKNLSCNEENGWVKCSYSGGNPQIGKNGKAYFDEDEGVWMYKPKGGKELYRLGQGNNLAFERDKDVI